MGLPDELRTLVPDEERVTTGEDALARHSRSIAYHPPHLPDAVVFPENKEEVAAVLRYANERGVPVVPFGEGSSLEGHTIPVRGGISLDLGGMNRILEVRPDDFLARVEPGVTHGELNERLAEYEMFFPVDPGWDASLGGMAGTNASGTNAVRYGVMREQVLGLEVVLADGTALRTGGLAMKSSAGYNLTGLFVGSEGTLGVFTELVLRLYPVPETAVAARATFSDIGKAGKAAIALIRTGMAVGRVELVDERTVEAVNAYKGTAYTVSPTLFLEFSGDETSVNRDVAEAREVCSSGGAESFDFEEDEAGRQKLWEARHEAGTAVRNLYLGRGAMSTDVCVPISDLPGALVAARRTISDHGLDGAILGHVGDGNYHAIFPVDTADEEDVARAEKVNAEIVGYALERGGTCSGEHGIGSGKREHLRKEHGDSLPFMRGIKRLADPNGVLNPGKIFLD